MVTVDNILCVEDLLTDVDAVIFDLDDTLYSEKEYVKSGFKKIAEHFDNPLIFEALWTAFKNGGNAIDEALKKFGLETFKSESLSIYRNQVPDIHTYDGVLQMLDRIGKTKKVGIITDGRPEGQRAKLKALGITVDKVIITDELGGVEFRKPNKTAFCLMKDYFGVPFERMAYVGDNTSKDFTAPDTLGMKSIWFRNKDGLYVK